MFVYRACLSVCFNHFILLGLLVKILCKTRAILRKIEKKVCAMRKLLIIQPEPESAALLQRALDERGLTVCQVVPVMPKDDEGAQVIAIMRRDDPSAASATYVIEPPYRFGHLLDVIKNLQDKNDNPLRRVYASCALDTAHCLFFTPDQPDGIRLTEKEKDILLYLSECDPQSPVTKEALLEGVWGFNQNVETHTLETHVYRLRQKIEKNPAKPLFLITKDDGYIFQRD
ncbi:MAG: hypothetical protein CMH27_07210 [Micavibrio sp.]|nr:hypothetical protein [Micavibrio sp.]